jgi:hypothetical protein
VYHAHAANTFKMQFSLHPSGLTNLERSNLAYSDVDASYFLNQPTPNIVTKEYQRKLLTRRSLIAMLQTLATPQGIE